ncbi:unnamed protein product, partial [Didymodactylos carnosus]
TSRIIAKLACWSHERMPVSDLGYYLAWLKEQLKPQGNDYLQSVCRSLQMMLRIEQYRESFVSIDGITNIMHVLNNASIGFQVQYQLTFCLWVLAFAPNIASVMAKYNVIPRLTEILTETEKEKVTRMIVAFLRNLLEKPEDEKVIRENAMTMIASRLVKPLELLSSKPYDDNDIKEDIELIKEKLEGNLSDVSSFDEYALEIRSGRLSWSPVHQSEKFWRDNATKLNDANFELIRMLLKLLEHSKEPLVLCVAAHDVGEYVRHYPHGKKTIDKLDGKVIIMRLLEHPDSNVRYQGLLCVQKLMVHNWDYLGKQVDSDSKSSAASGEKMTKRMKYPSVIDRYFTKYFQPNVHNEYENDVMVLVHSNRICVLTLSDQHPIIKQQLKIDSVESLTSINDQMSGKSKRGADYIHTDKLLYRIVCSNGKVFTICSSIRGRLIEMNDKLLIKPELLHEQPHYLAIMIPSLKDYEINLQQLLNETDYILFKDKQSICDVATNE